MPKLNKQYLTFREFLVLPIELPEDDEPRSINTSVIGIECDREITPLTQVKGSFQPLADMKKDLMDTFKPYRSAWYAKRDAKQPLDGLFNFFKGIGYIFGSLLLFIALPVYFMPQKNRQQGVGYFSALGRRYVCTLSWFIDGILSIVRGATQIATTPLTWFIKMPLRGIITAFTHEKDLLIENKPSIQALVTKAKTASAGILFFKNAINCDDWTREIHRKYKKGVRAGCNSAVMHDEEKKLYRNVCRMFKPGNNAQNRSKYFALFQPEKVFIASENNQAGSDNVVANTK